MGDKPGMSVKIQEISPAPPLESFSLSTAVPEGIAGNWTAPDCQLNIEPEGESGKWRVSAQVGNSIGCVVTEQPGGGFSSGDLMSTMMMPPPHLQQREENIKMFLEQLTKITRVGDKLLLVASDMVEEFSWALGAPAATKDAIRWIK